MKSKKPPLSLDEIEFYPDAMERTKRAIKAAFRHGRIPKGTIKGASRRAPSKRPAKDRP